MNLMYLCIAPLVLTVAPISRIAAAPVDPTLVALQSCEDASLGSLRAGAPERRAALGVDELAVLQAADRAAAADLADLRGGELDDHDLTVIAVIALAIIAVAIIL
jgi:hypothetical protein